MKKIFKGILIAVAAIFVLVSAAGLSYGFPLLFMNPTETGQIPNTNIHAVKNSVGTAFFIKTGGAGGGYIMIDAGSNPAKFETSLKEEKIDSNDVKWILLTHSDGDHVAALNLFPNAAIYMSKDELPLVNGTLKRSPISGNVLPAGIALDSINLLTDGMELSFNGTSVECIKMPGHTTGSMAYLVDGKYLFTGDAFKFAKDTIDVHPFTMDKKNSRKTIEQFKKSIDNYSIVFTSHYGHRENNR